MKVLPSKVSVISKLELALDIYPSLSLILRYIYCLAFQGASLRALHNIKKILPDTMF